MTLAYDRTGSGPPLVLIHGIGSRRGAWKPVLARLARERDVIAVDLPGFGDSPPLPAGTAPTVGALADAVLSWWTALGIGRPHVAGNSLGGGIALELARRGAVASATALSPIGFWSEAERRYSAGMLRISRLSAERLREPMQRAVRSPAGRLALLGLFFGKPARRDGDEAAADVAALGGAPAFETTRRCALTYRLARGEELDVPVTIGWGTRDALLLPWQATRARAAIPRARHVPLPGCGHVPMSDDPDGVAALLLAGSGG